MSTYVALYLRAHGVSRAVATLLCLVLAGVLAHLVLVPLPSAAGAVGVPFLRFVPLAVAVVAAGTLGPANVPGEWVQGRRLRKARALHLVVLMVTVLVLAVPLGLALPDRDGVWIAARATTAWLGLSLISQSLLGPKLTWALPVLSIAPLIYFGSTSSGAPALFNWTAHAPAWPTEALAGALGACGLLLALSSTGQPRTQTLQ